MRILFHYLQQLHIFQRRLYRWVCPNGQPWRKNENAFRTYYRNPESSLSLLTQKKKEEKSRTVLLSILKCRVKTHECYELVEIFYFLFFNRDIYILIWNRVWRRVYFVWFFFSFSENKRNGKKVLASLIIIDCMLLFRRELSCPKACATSVRIRVTSTAIGAAFRTRS